MTKRHFIALADMIRDLNPALCNAGHGPKVEDGREMQYNDTIEVLARFCAEQNPQFDRARWLGYIAGTNGPSGGKK